VVVLLTVAMGALATYGGSSRRPITTSHPALFNVRMTPPPTDATRLPGSSGAPMTCTAYESNCATQVIFVSETFDVRAECRAWTRNRADVGYLWSPLEAMQLLRSYFAEPRGLVLPAPRSADRRSAGTR